MDRYQQYMYSYPHKTAYRPLQGYHLKNYKGILKKGRHNSLYFHIPFCETKCGYCNLFSLTGQSSKTIAAYLNAMERQAAQADLSDVEFYDLTIGGGTPLLLSEQQLERLLALAEQYFTFSSATRELIVETSPRQTKTSKLCLLKEHGATRVSLGVQSFLEEELCNLHRCHKASDAETALQLLKDTHFSCINVDLIYGIPGQTLPSLTYSLEKALSYEPEEIFLYPLYIKPGTRLFQEQARPQKDRFLLYDSARNLLQKRGYHPTSMRRFVRRISGDFNSYEGCGFSEHTLSIGCGGRSYIGNLHFCTPFRVRPASCQSILKDYLTTEDYGKIDYGYVLSEEEQKRRFLLKNLLYIAGLPVSTYQRLFSADPFEDFPLLHDWVGQGYARLNQDHLTLTQAGMDLSDYLGPKLISREVREKMEEWNDVY